MEGAGRCKYILIYCRQEPEGGTIKQFEVTVQDEVGHLAEMVEVLAHAGINIVTISSERSGRRNAVMRLITSDDEKARKVFESEGIRYKYDDILAVRLEDKPGALFQVANRLKAAGVNMASVYIVNKADGHTDVALDVDDLQGAREALTDLIID